jgi:hypothetical protein
MDSDNGSVDHLDGAIVGLGKGFHEVVPDASRSPADKAIVADHAYSEVRNVTRMTHCGHFSLTPK